jgi:monofunctional biosynthetic peptidoglycan transglycosylase
MKGRPLARGSKGKGGWVRRTLRLLLLFVLIFGFVGPAAVVLIYRFVPPPITWLMVQRTFEGRGFARTWVPLDRISPQLVRSVIAAEDARFCQHHGFDFLAMQKAMEANARGGKIRGGSTISRGSWRSI